MTAILSYFDKHNQIAYIICDALAQTKEGPKTVEKCSALYDRFYIAPWGPDVLPSAICILRDIEAYDNIIRPARVEDLISMLYSIYKKRLPAYKAGTSTTYQNEEKEQGALIYDYEAHEMFSIIFGQPFKDAPPENAPKPVLLGDGLHKFALFAHDRNISINESAFLQDPLGTSKEAFEELEKSLKSSANLNLQNQLIGNVGTRLKRVKRFREMTSAFQSFNDYVQAF